ncbi:hypothetical protein X737_35525 [Mesorhizobium sp. L48C026A00]|nr:hypothetical protein X737_35525 [Mesorhizobium sp. L48C026A00]
MLRLMRSVWLMMVALDRFVPPPPVQVPFAWGDAVRRTIGKT